jgi:hypothetical protein
VADAASRGAAHPSSTAAQLKAADDLTGSVATAASWAGLVAMFVTMWVVSQAIRQRCGALTARALGRVSPVEALRRLLDPPARPGVIRLLAALACAGGAVAALTVAAAKPTQQMEDLISLPLFGIVLLLCAVAAAGPLLLPLITKAWTALLPVPAATWIIARQQAASRVNRASATVVPLAVALALPMAFLTISGTLQTAAALGKVGGSGVEIGGLVSFFGPSVVIALAGALAGILIASRSRALDVALTSINGAGPSQTWGATALDGVIAMGTAVVVAALTVAVGSVSATLGLRRHFGHADLSWPLATWLAVAGVAVVGGTAATLLAAARTLAEPPFEVIGRFVAE